MPLCSLIARRMTKTCRPSGLVSAVPVHSSAHPATIGDTSIHLRWFWLVGNHWAKSWKLKICFLLYNFILPVQIQNSSFYCWLFELEAIFKDFEKLSPLRLDGSSKEIWLPFFIPRYCTFEIFRVLQVEKVPLGAKMFTIYFLVHLL